MEEAERCCRLAFLHEGSKVADGSPDEIKNSLQNKRVYSCRTGYNPALKESLKKTNGVIVLNQFGNELRIIAESSLPEKKLAEILRQSLDGKASLNPVAPNIEDVFITLTHGGQSI